MTPYPMPAREGHWWAKLKLADDPDLNSVDWEVVQVFENDPSGSPSDPEHFMVSVPGIAQSQLIDAFVWGPPVHQPAELR